MYVVSAVPSLPLKAFLPDLYYSTRHVYLKTYTFWTGDMEYLSQLKGV